MNIEDPSQLLAYLRETGRIGSGEEPRFSLLSGGVSNRAVLVRTSGGDWVIKQALPKLRVTVDWFSDPARIDREAAALRALHPALSGHIPDLVFHDPAHHLLAISAVPQPHDNWKTLLLNERTSAEQAREFAVLLARIHSARVDDPSLETEFAERRFFEELRLEPYYSYAAEQVPGARDFLHGLISDTRQRRLALVHGDFSPKNVLVARGKLILLDFEVMHFGDPAFDIGFSLTHLLSKAHHLPGSRSAFLDMARVYWREYAARARGYSASEIDSWAARHTLACLLARIDGRSTLEYLDETERRRQRAIVLDLMGRDLAGVNALIDAFESELARRD